MSQGLRKLTAAISKSNCIVIFINQIREKIGVMFGNPETTTGKLWFSTLFFLILWHAEFRRWIIMPNKFNNDMTEDDIKFLEDNYEKLSVIQIANKLKKIKSNNL